MASTTVKSRILGADGEPIQYEVLGEEISAGGLTGIRQVWHTGVAAGLTPTRLAGILEAAAQGDAHEYLTLAEEMEERDLHYASVLGTRKLALSGLAIRVDALSDDKADVRLADAVRELLAVPDFDDMVSDLTDALGKGYSAAEIIWDRSGRTWMPDRLEHRDPRFFQFDRETGRELRLLDDAEPVNGIALPAYKFIVHLPRLRTGLPIRGGLARLAAVGYMCKAWSWKDWMAFADIFGLPMRVGRYGPSASKDDIAKLMSAVANLGSDAAAVMPESTKIEFEQAANTAGAADFFEKLANWWDKQVSKGVLGQTMTADDGASLSQAQVHNDVRLDLLQADAKALQNTLNRDLIRPFVDLNFGPGRYPKLVVHVPEPEDLKLLVDSLGVLVPMGLQVEQSVIRDKLGLPDPDPGAVLLTSAAPAAPSVPALGTGPDAPMPVSEDVQAAALNGAQVTSLRELLGAAARREMPLETARAMIRGAFPLLSEEQVDGMINPLLGFVMPAGPAPARAANREHIPVPDREDQLAQLLASEADPLVADMVSQIRVMVDGAGSLEEIRAGLDQLAPDLDLTRFTGVMQYALAAAGLAGMSDAGDDADA